MKELLSNLNGVPGIDGSMVITDDGIMVAEALGPQLDEDVIAALSSSLLIALKRALEPVDGGSTVEMILSADDGKLIFTNLGNAFLVVVTRPNLKLDTGLVEIRSFTRKLKSLCTFAG